MHETRSPRLKRNRRDRRGHGILPLMPELHERLAERVRDWRAAGYPSDRPPQLLLGEELLLTAEM